MWKNTPRNLLLLITVITLPDCNRPEQIHRLESYQWNPSSALIERVATPPPFVISYLRELDKRPDYRAIIPDTESMKRVDEAFRFLPDSLRRILQQRCIGIYFIEGFATSGLTEWAINRDGAFFCFMAFHPKVLSMTASEVITVRERTAFINDAPEIKVRIQCAGSLNGFSYILMHEAAHAADYACRITPYVEHAILPYLHRLVARTPFTETVWADYHNPLHPLSFTGAVFFYGVKEPKLRLSRAREVYRELVSSPFPSLYAATSWAEDAADLAFFCHIERKNLPYRIEVLTGETVIDTFYPMKSRRILKRCDIISTALSRCDDYN